MKNSNKEEFILKARQVHGWKYDYSKVEYVNSKTKVCIICPKHGEFWQTPNSHLSGRGCLMCKIENSRLTTEEFIKRARKIHDSKYDYSKVNYTKCDEDVCIICPKHGEFYVKAIKHIGNGRTNQIGCKLCGEEDRRKHTRKSTEWFMEQAKKIHGDKYDYSKVEYNRTDENVCIICPKHGEFWQSPNRHLSNHGCPKCGGNEKLTIDDFVRRSNEIHKNKYDYSKVDFKGTDKKVCIICPKHGEFWQYASGHMSGRGCPHCKSSALENEIRNFLDKESIKYVAQKRAKWLDKQSLDFYLPDFNLAIECQGEQHFIASGYFGGVERLKKTIELDGVKRKKCNDNNVKIIYYTHCNCEYEFELIKDLETLKEKIYGENKNV